MKIKKKTPPISSVNIVLPKRWSELTDKQLLYYYFLKAERYTEIAIQGFCFFRWAGIEIIERLKEGVSVKMKIEGKKESFIMHYEDVQFGVNALSFLSEETPSEVIQVEQLGPYKAVNKYLQQVPFKDYLVCENNYQGYIHTKEEKYIENLARLLYRKKTSSGKSVQPTSMFLNEVELLAVMGWWFSFKLFISRKFSALFTKEEGSVVDVEAAMNGQIRALTGGDATKEKEVFELDTWRALTELNEKAREVSEIKQRYGK